ncbi:MAG: hypothetical protein GEU89_07600 [Kiloniellaceae bacterium]|nr:hypothetical protein [Kiloniellaceae bacterium]
MAEAREVAGSRLAPAETLVWAGRPGAWALARSKFAGTRLPSYLFAAFVLLHFILWFHVLADEIAGAWSVGNLIVGILAACLVIALSLLLVALFSRWVVYAVTDRRVLIIRTWPVERCRSAMPSTLHRIVLRTDADGRGDVIFNKRTWYDLPWMKMKPSLPARWMGGPPFPPRWEWPVSMSGDEEILGFFGIRGAREVAGEIGRLRQRERAAAENAE